MRSMTMPSIKELVLWGVAAPCFAVALAVGGAAESQPESTPAEQAQTQQLNQNAGTVGTQDKARYQEEQQRYRQEQQDYLAQKQKYQDQAASYEAARDRYAAERKRYHRGEWPSDYGHRIIADNVELMGVRVETYSGRAVGHVEQVARSATGHVDALRIALDHGGTGDHGDVWIDVEDLRFDADARIVMTDWNRDDLYAMAKEG